MVTLFFWLTLFQFISSPSFLKYTGLADSVALLNPAQKMDPYTIFTIGELVKSGSLISVDELWSFESAFYQTIITFLIAINGIIGVLAFFVIKNSSNDNARESAIAHSKTYIDSSDFKKRVQDEVQEKIKGIQDDYLATLTDLKQTLETSDQRDEIIERITRDNAEIQRHINLISKRISSLDKQDTAGGSLTLRRKGK